MSKRDQYQTKINDLKTKIADLQKKADAAKQVENKAAMLKIKEFMEANDIALHELAALFKVTKAKPAKPKPPKKKERIAHYSDDNGNTWSGMGRMPNWLKNAVADGKTLEQFRV